MITITIACPCGWTRVGHAPASGQDAFDAVIRIASTHAEKTGHVLYFSGLITKLEELSESTNVPGK